MSFSWRVGLDVASHPIAAIYANAVIPAKAGIHNRELMLCVDPRFRGDDGSFSQERLRFFAGMAAICRGDDGRFLWSWLS